MSKKQKPDRPYPDFPLFAHHNGQWAKKVKVDGKWTFAYFGPWNDPNGALKQYNEWLEENLHPEEGAVKKPSKPYPDFPLYAHSSGKWAIVIKDRATQKRKTFYFRSWDDPEGALEDYLASKKDILAGRPVAKVSGLTIRELCNRFLASKQKLVNSGELAQRSWDDYHDACEKVIEVFGKSAKVANLQPADFEDLRDFLWKGRKKTKRSPVSVANDIGRIRVVFNFAEDEELIPGRIRYGKSFKKPSAKIVRKSKNKNGKKKFEAEEIKKILEIASPQMKAMILLGINCGFGNNDCALLTADHIKDGWHDFSRPKTGVERHCPLWPETIEALSSFKCGDKHVFITKYGKTWEAKSQCDSPISKEMVKLMKKTGTHQIGRGFYALRHTFNTIGLRTKDSMAVKYIMGHTPSSNDMTENYNQEPPPDEDLIVVTEYVRKWLFGK